MFAHYLKYKSNMSWIFVLKVSDKIYKWLGMKVNIWKEFSALKYKIELNENFSPKFPIKENIKKIA